MPFKTANPLRLNQHDTARLPAYCLWLLAALYIIAGLAWRGIWRQEAASFGTMLTMAHGSINDWLYPHVAGAHHSGLGPLPYWLGALSIQLWDGLLTPFQAAQTAIALQNAASIYLLHRTIYRLGKRAELQPQRLVFGGEPAAQDYGRMLADSAALLFIATYGIATTAHDTGEGATWLLACLLWLYGAVSCLERPATYRWTWGLGLAAMGLTLPFTLFVLFIFTTLGVLFFDYWREHSTHTAPVVLLVGLLLPSSWLFRLPLDASFFEAWLAHQHLTPISAHNAAFFARNSLLFLWPIAPLALWCVWRWRLNWRNPMFFLGSCALLTPLLHILITGQRHELSLLTFVPACLLLAPFGLATLNRGRANIIDWFSVVTFTLLALGAWVMWLASWTGIPSQWAHNIHKLAPEFQPQFKWWPFIIAALVSVGWVLLLRWRARCPSKALWQSMVFSSGGLVLVWTLLATLWMPWLDYTRNYERVGQSLKAAIPAQTSCVRGVELSQAARGALHYYAGIPFVPDQATFSNVNCPYILTHENQLKLLDRVQTEQTLTFKDQTWRVVWLGERISERKNALVLLRQP
ncbi:MAG: hypothetical protein ACRCV6_07865 [Formosimonas sp.]